MMDQTDLKQRVEQALVDVEDLGPATLGGEGFGEYTIDEPGDGSVIVHFGPTVMAGFVRGDQGVAFRVSAVATRAVQALDRAGLKPILQQDDRGVHIKVTEAA